MKQSEISQQQIHLVLFIIGILVFVWSYIGHYDTFGWAVLVSPILLGVAFFSATYKRFTFSTFVYFFGLLWIIILLIGAKYTYSNNPMFNWISDSFGWSRNYYDRVGHFAQGFVPVIVIKEYLYRKNILKPSNSSIVILISLVLAFSALYELSEFAATVISNRPQSYILDLQGDMWDTQWDMVMAILGASVSLLLFGKRHNRIIQTIKNKTKNK